MVQKYTNCASIRLLKVPLFCSFWEVTLHFRNILLNFDFY